MGEVLHDSAGIVCFAVDINGASEAPAADVSL